MGRVSLDTPFGKGSNWSRVEKHFLEKGINVGLKFELVGNYGREKESKGYIAALKHGGKPTKFLHF